MKKNQEPALWDRVAKRALDWLNAEHHVPPVVLAIVYGFLIGAWARIVFDLVTQ